MPTFKNQYDAIEWFNTQEIILYGHIVINTTQQGRLSLYKDGLGNHLASWTWSYGL